MKNRILLIIAACVGVLISSCHTHEDDNDIVNGNGNKTESNDSVYAGKIVNDENSGKFVIQDLTTKTVLENHAEIRKGDTLLIRFIPNDKYKDKAFDLTYTVNSGSDAVKDSLVDTSNFNFGENKLLVEAVHKTDSFDLSATQEYTFKIVPKSIVDTNAGKFEITDITSGDEIGEDDQPYHFFVGDTVKIVFHPNTGYENMSFSISCSSLTWLNDSLWVVPDLGTTNGNVQISKNIWIQAEYKNKNEMEDFALSSERILKVFTYKEYADVTYLLDVSQDLLQFINTTIVYTDDSGEEQIINLKDEDWIKETFEYDGETEDYAYYKLNIHYDKLDKDHYVKAIYSKKEDVAITDEPYNFSHYLKWGPAVVAGLTFNNISINIDIYTGNNKVNVADYLEKLVNNPDVVKIHLDKRSRKIETIK